MLVWSAILDALIETDRCVMVSVVDAKGSVPREAGARMVVRDNGGFSGTIGGGALEWQALKTAQSLARQSGSAAVVIEKQILGPDLGQCCGGQVTLTFECFTIADLPQITTLRERERRGIFFTKATLDENSRSLRRQVFERPEPMPDTARLARSGELIERFGERVRPVALFGSGHVGRAMVLALAPLPFHVSLVDSRKDAFPAYLPANVTPVHVDDPVEIVGALPDDAFIVIMSHSHALDEAITGAALLQRRFAFVGLIGSATKRARFANRLAARGVDRTLMDFLVCPIGVAGIRSKKPAAIAASTVAQLLLIDEQLGHAKTRLGRKTTVGEPAH
jgi:xanthine dehydrogenase accessory factor